MSTSSDLPLSGIKVVEFTHMVMGPTVGVILADLGADVIKVEPLKGDNTRRLMGSGSGYFPMYNRNKKSVCLDLKAPEGNKIARALIDKADVVIENFRPGAMDKLGFGYTELSKDNSRLIYCSAKGFLAGPYEKRTALDEVCQMMGGLAYMTGPPGKPLRAGASVIDVTGGMFSVIGILAALEERHRTGKGQQVKSSLFETTVYLVGQHMAQYAVTGKPASPMPVRVSAWAIYDVFETKDDSQVFVGVVSDTQWKKFCEFFDLPEFGNDETMAANNDRVQKRDVILPKIQEMFKQLTRAELLAKLEEIGLPFAPIMRPEDLLDDPHLKASGGLLDLTIPGGDTAKLPALPLEMDGHRFGVRQDLPKEAEHTKETLSDLGYSDAEIQKLVDDCIARIE